MSYYEAKTIVVGSYEELTTVLNVKASRGMKPIYMDKVETDGVMYWTIIFEIKDK